MGNELRAILHSQLGRCWLELEQLPDRVDLLSSFAATANMNSQADSASFNDHVQELEGVTLHCLVELEVDRLYVMLVFRAQQLSASLAIATTVLALSSALSLSLRSIVELVASWNACSYSSDVC